MTNSQTHIAARNDAENRHHLFLKKVIYALLGLFVLSVVGLVLEMSSRPTPGYVEVNSQGMVVKAIKDIDYYKYSELHVKQWLTYALDELFNYNYENMDQHFVNLSERFMTDGGLQSFYKTFRENRRDAVKSHRYFVSSVLTEPPALKKKGTILINGKKHKVWVFQVQLLSSYVSAAERNTITDNLAIKVMSTDSREKQDRLAIDQIVAASGGN